MTDRASAEPERRPLCVGFLHLGRARSGLRRYGTVLAAEARRHEGLRVIESDVGDRDASWASLWRAGRQLRGADVVHVQWKLADWDPRTGGIPRMEVFLNALRRPTVVTLHDIFERHGRWDRQLSPSAIGLRRLGRAAARLVVHSHEEERRLDGLVPSARLEVVPHFVERRGGLPDRTTARAELGLAGQRVVTLLGYLTKRRGHRLVIDAMARLPADVTALFVGSTIEGRGHVARDLEAHAAALGVAERVRFMGYVDDTRLELVLSATDVALCPFRMMSASGALATWISAGRPIVASALDPLRELDALAPGALHLFEPYEPEALAASILATLAVAREGRDPLVSALAERLATARIIERYAGVYRAALET